MKPLTKALIEGLTACDSDEMIIKLLVDMGFTPPPDKPEPQREPFRAWVTATHDGGHYVSKDTPGVRAGLAENAVPLIEAGWCKMVEHDGSDQCPVDPDARVIYMNKMAKGWTKASNLTWRMITHYAVILENKE